MYGTLVGQDGGGTIVPRLARVWDQSPTGVTFTLKQGVTCSDGRPPTSPQVAATLTRYQASPAGAAVTFGPGNTAGGTMITGDDKAGTVSIRLTAPWGELLPVSVQQSRPASARHVRRHGPAAPCGTLWGRCGTGSTPSP